MVPPPKIGISILNLEFSSRANSLLRKKIVSPEINRYRHLEFRCRAASLLRKNLFFQGKNVIF